MSNQSADPGPIETKHHELMNAVGAGLDDVFNGEVLPGLPRTKHTGFLLCVFDFGEPHPGSRFNYISNADRLDVLATLKDIVARLEGRYSTPGRA